MVTMNDSGGQRNRTGRKLVACNNCSQTAIESAVYAITLTINRSIAPSRYTISWYRPLVLIFLAKAGSEPKHQLRALDFVEPIAQGSVELVFLGSDNAGRAKWA
jgi:hypothetical protein